MKKQKLEAAEAVIAGDVFKTLIKAVTRFPSVGAFLGSELVHLTVSGGVAVATTMGVVLARATGEAEGTLPRIAMDERALEPFAKICSKRNKVVITYDGATVKLKRGTRELVAALSDAKEHVITKTTGTKLELNQGVADDLKFLSSVAMSDPSKPEMCCVMVLDGKAIASNQKALAVLNCTSGFKGRVALPLPLLKGLNLGDALTVGVELTALTSSNTLYMMPSPIKAQKDFPVDKLLAYEQNRGELLAECIGEKFVIALRDCVSCIGNMARTEIVAKAVFKDGRMELTAQNGGMKFKAVVPIKQKGDGELNFPLEEAILAAPLFESEKVFIHRGKNGETFLLWSRGWCMFPSWKEQKK